jgi:polysaccharide pyruvyl transferase WcaK-like protein
MTTIHIYADTNGNWGDKALGLGTQNVFSKNLGIKNYEVIPLETFTADINKLENQDLIIVGGGGIIRELLSAYRGSFASFNSPTIGYALGLNTFVDSNGQDSLLSQSNSTLLRSVITRDFKYFSVRNDDTKENLEKIGLSLPETPDPGLWSGMNLSNSNTKKEEYVIIQLAGDMYWNRFFFNEVDIISFTKRINIVKNFLNQRGYNVCFAYHRIEDKYFLKYITQPFQEWTWNTTMPTVPQGLINYRDAKFVIGMRGHAQIIPFGFGVPPIALVNQSKNYSFMQKVGLERYCVNIKEKLLELTLEEKISELENEYDYVKKHIRSQLKVMDQQVVEEFKIIKEKLEW